MLPRPPRLRHLLPSLLLASSVVTAACGGEDPATDAAPTTPDAGPTPDAPPPTPSRVGVFGEAVGALDVLVVVDDSASMGEEQAALAEAFGALTGALAALPGGLPDLHVGVVSSNVGAGPYPIAGCTGGGDGGALQAAATVVGCAPPDGAFLSDVDDGAGGRTRNYTGTLPEAFSCISQLGTTGCGFEQHLESMRRALNGSAPGNAGFLRADAALLIVVLADEDDCSALDTTMFDPTDSSPTSALGRLSSFRCFEFGVDCAVGNDDRRAQGPRDACTPRDDSPYMYHPDEYVEFLRSLKADPTRVMVSVIVGVPTPVAVGPDPNDSTSPALSPSCVSVVGEASPAIRLAHFAAQFPARHVVSSICNEDLGPAVADTSALLQTIAGSTCLVGDTPATVPALYEACTVADVVDLDAPTETRAALDSCDATGDAPPCFRFVADDACTLNAAGARVELDRGATAPPPGSVVVVDCL